MVNNQGIGVVGLYVDDQDEALAFYVGKLGFQVHTDVRNGSYRWLTVQHPDQPDFQLGLFRPGPPIHDEATAQALRSLVAKGAMPPLVLHVADCRATWAQWLAKGVEFTQEPVDPLRQCGCGFPRPGGQWLEADPAGVWRCAMSAGAGLRRFHRWVSMAFTLTVTANFVFRGMGSGTAPDWLTYAPLPPLAFLWVTGLCLWLQPCLRRSAGAARVPSA